MDRGSGSQERDPPLYFFFRYQTEQRDSPLADDVLLELAQCRLMPLNGFGTALVGSLCLQIGLDRLLNGGTGRLMTRGFSLAA